MFCQDADPITPFWMSGLCECLGASVPLPDLCAPRRMIRKHLLAFSLAAPVMALVTYVVIKSYSATVSDPTEADVPSQSSSITGLVCVCAALSQRSLSSTNPCRASRRCCSLAARSCTWLPCTSCPRSCRRIRGLVTRPTRRGQRMATSSIATS